MYIKLMHENRNIYVTYWLLLITFFVAIMIVVGGLTRLTDSGLSITKWDLISGIVPPISLNDWNEQFSLYKKIPEFKEVYPSMTLQEFKIIYLWEYAHRLLGRIIGLLYLFPLIYFTVKKVIPKSHIYSFYLIFILILVQGFIGWYMVKSGLVDRVDVSHFRLSLHLTLAFVIFILLFWNYLRYNNKENFSDYIKIPFNLPIIFLFLLLIQISLGALVSGLDAGKIYQSWPLMNGSYFPDDSSFMDLSLYQLLNTPSQVQFLHRNIAYLTIVIFLIVFLIIFKDDKYFYLRKSALLILFFLFLQVFLGILTILSGATIIISSLHQIGSIFLVGSSVILVFKNSKINLPL